MSVHRPPILYLYPTMPDPDFSNWYKKETQVDNTYMLDNPDTMSHCPQCNSDNYTETARVEECQDCGYSYYYESHIIPPTGEEYDYHPYRLQALRQHDSYASASYREYKSRI
jgi:transposase-like protein